MHVQLCKNAFLGEGTKQKINESINYFIKSRDQGYEKKIVINLKFYKIFIEMPINIK